VAGTSYDVLVRRTTAQGTQLLTCRAAQENPVPAYDVMGVKRTE